MGNAGSNHPKEWNRDTTAKTPDVGPSSPCKEGEAFTFDKKAEDRSHREDDSNIEDGAPYYTKAVPESSEDFTNVITRERSNTLTDSNKDIEESKVLPTVFKWEGGGKQVFISGTFTDWKTIPMVKSHGDFVTIIDLPEGEHQYKYYVDGEWRHDPTVKVIDNGMGSKNNLVTVKMSDFEVFQALAKDSEGVHSGAQTEYSQEIPQSKPWEKVSGPPILPPHLLQVILNKDTPLSKGVETFEKAWLEDLVANRHLLKTRSKPSYNYNYNSCGQLYCASCDRIFRTKIGCPATCGLTPDRCEGCRCRRTRQGGHHHHHNCEPTLLPEPNHVMLNHLYALSIKDGVMVLSATHRYRKKYVTTLLYKPI